MATDEKAIRDLIARWHAATATGDVGTVLTLMSEDVTFLVPGKPPMRGRSTFEKGLRTLLQSHQIESTAQLQELQVSGDMAYGLTFLTVKIIPINADEADVRTGYTLSIFQRQVDSSWLLVRDANLLPAP